MPTVTERLEAYTQFDRDYRDKRAVEIDDLDADSPADNEPVHVCSCCGYHCLDRYAVRECMAGREDVFWCPRCIRGGKLKGAA